MRMPALPRLLHLPHSLRNQFVLVLGALALLIAAGGITAVYSMRILADTTRQLAGQRLSQMQQAQDLVLQSLAIERETRRMQAADTVDTMRSAYANIIDGLTQLDALVESLAIARSDVSVLSLHQSSQLLRNTAHVVASLQENALLAAAGEHGGQTASLASLAQAQANQRQFRDQLQYQTAALASTAQDVSAGFTEDYRQAVSELAAHSQQSQERVLILLLGSLLLAWLVFQLFLMRQVLARLQQVSHHLRDGDASGMRAGGVPLVPVQGGDEIGQMARAVEQFLADRQRLFEANAALEVEKANQAALIRQLADTQSQLLQSEKLASIGQLAAGVAHEINNPVGFVHSNLGTLRDYVRDISRMLDAYEDAEPSLPEAQRNALETLKAELDLPFLRQDLTALLGESTDGLKRVKRIVQDLRDFSHIDAGERQWANLEHGLDSTLNVAWNEIKYKADVVKEYAGIPEIECIPSQLNQVFLNLMINAAHAIAERGRIILRTDREGDSVWVEVEDNGSGIAPENLGRIFDPFFTTKPVGQGTGLGLSLSYGIVQKHGGRIDVRSTPGQGTVFRVTLPIQFSAAQSAATTH